MKKLLIMFLFFIYYSFSQNLSHESQDTKAILIGPNFGVNYNSIGTNKDTLSAESGFGYNLGIHFIYTLGNNNNSKTAISFYFDLVSRNNTINDVQNNYNYNLTNNYLILRQNYDFAVYINSRSQIIVHCGPYFSYLINSDLSSESDIEILEYEFQNFEVGLGFGLSYIRNFGKYDLGFDYNYMLGLTDAFGERDFRYESHNINLIFTLHI